MQNVPVFTTQNYSTSDPSQQFRSDLERSLISVSRLIDKCSRRELSRQEREWCFVEIKKSIRAIEWDCDDLEHTLQIVTKDSKRFGVSPSELKDQKLFLQSTQKVAAELKQIYFGTPATQIKKNMASGSGYKYSRLNDNDNDAEQGNSGNSDGFDDILFKQQQIIREQDDDLELVSRSVGTLKNMSYKISDELESQNVMLDELGSDMDRVDSKLDGVMKKIAKLTHLDDDKSQCKMIFILSCLLFFLVFILIIV